MTFLYSKYVLPIFVCAFLFTILIVFNNQKKLATIKRRWNLLPSIKYRISLVFYILFWSTLFTSMLDFRGPEISVKANKPISKTLILIDVSTSMFAEDVKPNRLKKAVMLARHFVKNHGVGDIGILIFSDTTKKLVPFTDDRDLLDSRLGALEDLKYENAGSNLPIAISESLSYLASESSKSGAVGNIMVISDAETHEDFNIVGSSERVRLAFVAVGTTKGANIPIRDRNNVFRGYKEFNGSPIVTKINESFLKTLSNKFNMYKYWVIYSYSLPTDEILNFMSSESAEDQDGVIKQRPVLGHLLIALSLLFYLIYTFLRSGKSFHMALCIPFLLINPKIARATEIKTDLSELSVGKSSSDEKGNIVARLIEEKKNKEAGVLASEVNVKDAKIETRLNIATAELLNNKTMDAIEKYNQVLASDVGDDVKNKIRENLLISLNKKLDQKGNQNKEDKKKSEKNDKSDDQNQGQGKGSKGQQKQDKDEQGKDKQKEEEKKQEQDSKNKDGEKDEEQKQQKLTNQNRTNKAPKSKSQLAGLLEQLKSNDKQLQKEFIETSAKERGSKGKDW